MRLHNPRRASAIAVAAGLIATVAVGTAHADPAQPGTTDAAQAAAADGAQPGTTDDAAAPTAPTPAAAPAGGEVPAVVNQAVPGVSEVAQPLQPAAPQVVSEPEIVYVQGEPEIRYVDRVVEQEVEVVEENGTLLLLDPDYQNQIRPEKVADDAVRNYGQYDRGTQATLNTTAAAAGAGAVGGAVVGGAVGAVGTGVTGAVGGALAGATAAPVATAPLCAIGMILVPAAGGVSCVVTAAGTGAAGGAIVGGAAGIGAGAVAGSATGAAAGAAGAASLVPGGTEAVQDLVADTAHDTENDLRVNNGFRGLVGDKPSGLPGEIPAEESTETRNVDGTTLAAEGPRHAAPEAEPAPAPEVPTEPRHAAPEVPEVPELEQPYQQVIDTVDTAQNAANDFGNAVGEAANEVVDQGKADFASFVQQANLPI